TPAACDGRVSGLTFGLWRPQFVVLPNCAVPRLGDWHKASGSQGMKTLEPSYRVPQHWSAGPHRFVADVLIWVFTPLTVSGVHSPSWNSIAWGGEMVGDYNVEPFSPQVRDNAVSALATLHGALGLDPNSPRPHQEDPPHTHDCPGKNVNKADVIDRILGQLPARQGGEHTPPADS